MRSIIPALILFACIGCSEPKSEKQPNTQKSAAPINQLPVKPDQVSNKVEEEYDGQPPFPDTCTTTFDYLAEIRTTPKQLDIIVSGKGWNPEYYSCTWIWGEIIGNEIPEDTTVELRIHLVDLATLDQKPDASFLQSAAFQQNLIATYVMRGMGAYTHHQFDPNKTGKYPKPSHWSED